MRILRSAIALSLVILSGCAEQSPLTTETPVAASMRTSNNSERGWIFGRGGAPVEVSFEVIGGDAIIEGDINIGKARDVPATKEELVRQYSAQLSVIESSTCAGGLCIQRRWPHGTIPYTVSASFTVAQRDSILSGMAMITNKAGGVLFRPKASYDPTWVEYKPHSSVCNSSVGKFGSGFPGFNGAQVINLTSGCALTPGIVAHESLHALGAWHEQSRCDRENYVLIHWSNISDPAQYSKECSGSADYLEYTEESVMHYGEYYYAINPSLPTMTSLRGRDMGNRDSLASVDWRSLNQVYQPRGSVVTALYDDAGHPRLNWSALPEATGYAIGLVIVYEEYDDYNGTSTVYDHSNDWVGTVTTPTVRDVARPWTGQERCFLWQHTYGSASYAYYYEIAGTFADGVLGKAIRWPAPIAPLNGSCP